MTPNFIVLIAVAFIPLVLGYLWFHPKVFGGRTWQTIANLTDDQMNKAIKPWQLVSTLFLNFLLAVGVFICTVHQTHMYAITGPDADAFKDGVALEFMQAYGGNFLTFEHGIAHGLGICLLLFVIPILGYAVIFERKRFKYLLVNAGFWGISLLFMAGIISKWGGLPAY